MGCCRPSLGVSWPALVAAAHSQGQSDCAAVLVSKSSGHWQHPSERCNMRSARWGSALWGGGTRGVLWAGGVEGGEGAQADSDISTDAARCIYAAYADGTGRASLDWLA